MDFYDKRLEEDLKFILDKTAFLWKDIKNQNILITGGTGFFGSWLLESFSYINEKLSLNNTAYVLTRSIENAKQKSPLLSLNPNIKYLEGDIKNFIIEGIEFAYIIHAATDAKLSLKEQDPTDIFNTVILGTRNILEIAKNSKTKKLIYISSGAVYGRQPLKIKNVSEDYMGKAFPTDYQFVYSECKKFAESLCITYANKYGFEAKIARCFAFVGPYLPTQAHFAIGNFIHDAIEGSVINVSGDGTPERSYLYAADLSVWLWTILMAGKNLDTYNVGSDKAISILELAKLVSKSVTPHVKVKIAKKRDPKKKIERYIPKIDKAKKELNLFVYHNLSKSILKSINYIKNK